MKKKALVAGVTRQTLTWHCSPNPLAILFQLPEEIPVTSFQISCSVPSGARAIIPKVCSRGSGPLNSGLADYRHTPGCPFGKHDKHGHSPRHVLARRDLSP